jgi:iron(II)-dependent oxidoreductase
VIARILPARPDAASARPGTCHFDNGGLSAWVEDARRRTLDLAADLGGERLVPPRLPIVNPILWELGHVAWFQERWALHHAFGQEASLSGALYDSARVAHDTRWDLDLPPLARTLELLVQVRDRVLDRLSRRPLTPAEAYFVLLSVYHEDMHDEALLVARQALGHPAPALSEAPAGAAAPDGASGAAAPDGASGAVGDATFGERAIMLGSARGSPFVFDNEKWAHPVRVGAFAIARACVTEGEFRDFVEDRGYVRGELWSGRGREWLERQPVRHPVYWHRREPRGEWTVRRFDGWRPLDPGLPVVHVSWWEAEAFCRWAGRRLPTEAEWEAAATGSERAFPWGPEEPSGAHANLDGLALGPVPVQARERGDSPERVRQLVGNVWEWTASPFVPYPGFTPDPYEEYSQPWFGTHMVLRGGAWATRSRLIRSQVRNFYTPDRRDPIAGFRTCARER